MRERGGAINGGLNVVGGGAGGVPLVVVVGLVDGRGTPGDVGGGGCGCVRVCEQKEERGPMMGRYRNGRAGQ